jgi:hypothetical protein
MRKSFAVIAVVLFVSTGAAPAQTATPEALAAARTLVSTMKISDQFKGLLPGILLAIKPLLIQDRPETERDFDTNAPKFAEGAYASHLNAMIEAAATIYANNFTVDELRDMEAFYRKPVGQKVLEKSQALAQQMDQIGRDGSRKAAEDLRVRLAEIMRQKAK